MSDSPVDRDRVPPAYTTKIPFDPAKARKPITFASLPETFIEYLGHIAVLWGMFEEPFQSFLAATLSANGSKSRWLGLSFEQKSDLLRKEANKLFGHYPTLAIYISYLLGDARRLQIDRNLLLHGSIIIRIDTKEDIYQAPDVSIVVSGRRKGQALTKTYSEGDIEDLYYGLAHLTGRMSDLLQPNEGSLLRIAWRDRCFLLDFLRNHLPAPSFPRHHARLNHSGGYFNFGRASFRR